MPNLPEFYSKVINEYNLWRNQSVQQKKESDEKSSMIPDFIIRPLTEKISSWIETGITKLNRILAEFLAEKKDFNDLQSMEEKEFLDWMLEADRKSETTWKLAMASMTATGAGGGAFGFAALAAEIPLSLGVLLTFANRLALIYQLDVTSEKVQEAILAIALSGGEEIPDFKITPEDGAVLGSSAGKTAIKKILEKKGNFTILNSLLIKVSGSIAKKKAAQLVPVAGAAAGGIVNAFWCRQAMNGVIQFSRKTAADAYYSGKGILSVSETTTN